MGQPQTIPDDPAAELPPYVSARELAAFLGLDERLLAKWRSMGIGPAYVKLTPGRGGSVRYSRDDIRAYLAENRRTGRADV